MNRLDLKSRHFSKLFNDNSILKQKTTQDVYLSFYNKPYYMSCKIGRYLKAFVFVKCVCAKLQSIEQKKYAKDFL